MKRTPVWIGLLSLWMAQVSLAQRYSFKHYGPEEGLKTAVNRLLQDRDGFLWVGTSNGLFRYDLDPAHSGLPRGRQTPC